MKGRQLPMRLLLGISLLLAFGACDFYQEKDPLGSAFPSSSSRVSYAQVRDRVFVPYCISCHGSSGGLLSLESYSSVKAVLPRIEKSVLVTRSMPKGGVLPSAESELLAEWIRAGAPETVPNSQPGPGSDALRPDFASIKEKILQPRCIACHSAGGAAANVPLSSWRELIDSPRELVLPGNPEESGLLIALSRQDDRRMPPPTSGRPLSADELSVIRKWIELGAPETESGFNRPLPAQILSFAFVRATVFAPRCISCHGDSGDVSLGSYAEVKGLLSAIQSAVLVERKMPPSPQSSLSSMETDILAEWIKAGAPENPGDPIGGGEIPDPRLSYALLKERIFTPRCMSCHGTSGGVNLESYATTRENLAKIALVALAEKTMPPSGPLASEEASLLAAWIRAGAPEGPVEPEEPLKPLFSSIKKKIFERRCLNCHSAGGATAAIPLGTLREILDSPRELVLPGNAEESGLFIAISRTDSKRMPPPATGGPLTDEVITVIKTWIENGAPE